MGIFSKLFGKKSKSTNVRSRDENPDVYDIGDKDEAMNWGIEKANLTLHYFESCLRAPRPEQQYFSIKVKIIDGEKVEHIWLANPEFDEEGNLFGTIGNEPIDVTNVKLDQKIGIDRDLVSDWMIIEQGRLIGGYTIRAIREGLSGASLQSFDQSLGMILDEGEDYFPINSDTPEGAILLLEQAYDEDDIDKAVACKDFYQEAKIMLKETVKIDTDEAMIQSTAEALRLSFIKNMQEHGMPKFDGVKRAFPKRQKISDNHYIITEICYMPDGKAMDQLHTYKGDDGWKVLGVVRS